MAKYRSLTLEEVKMLEKEFIDFLVVNGIPADDWQKIKDSNEEKALNIIDSFSDIVFEKILRTNKYLLKNGKIELATVACLADKFHMIAVKYTDESKTEITEIYTSEKAYQASRESEMWEMLNQGFEISKGKEYLTLIEKV